MSRNGFKLRTFSHFLPTLSHFKTLNSTPFPLQKISPAHKLGSDFKALSTTHQFFHEKTNRNNWLYFSLMNATFLATIFQKKNNESKNPQTKAASASLQSYNELLDPTETLISEHLTEIKKTGVQTMLQAPLTETPALETAGLSDLAKYNLPQAIQVLANFSHHALAKHATFSERLKLLKKDCEQTLRTGGSILGLGCGSAGRANKLVFYELSKQFSNKKNLVSMDQIKLDIAGGSAALIRAIEYFEDSEKYGKMQIASLGIKPGDTVILLSASGSATFLKGTIRHIIYLNQNNDKKIKCYFIINNPIDESLQKSIFQDIPATDYEQDVHILSFPEVGQQALAGSTRMQAANFQILTLGGILADAIETVNGHQEISRWDEFCKQHLSLHEKIPFEKLEPLIETLTNIYLSGQEINITVDSDLAGVVTSDTTELAPTFKTTPLSHPSDAPSKSKKIASYQITIRGTHDPASAWEALLGRKLVALDLDVPQTQLPFILQYNLGPKKSTGNIINFDISITGDNLSFKLADTQVKIPLGHLSSSLESLQGLSKTQLIKDLLNVLSTLTMGRIDRYYSNLMIFVKPSNRKLVTRGIRLSYVLLTQADKLKGYEDLNSFIQSILQDQNLQEKFLIDITQVFYNNIRKSKGNNDSIVLETIEQIAKKIRSQSNEKYIEYLQTLQLSDLSSTAISSSSAALFTSEPTSRQKAVDGFSKSETDKPSNNTSCSL